MQNIGNNIKRVILIGIQGHGKTTLFNSLTGAQEKLSHYFESTTRNIMFGSSKVVKSEKSFEIIDTPGLYADEEQMQHITDILEALKQKNIHRIVFVIKHERKIVMINNIQKLLKIFEKYKTIQLYTYLILIYMKEIQLMNRIQQKQILIRSYKQNQLSLMKKNQLTQIQQFFFIYQINYNIIQQFYKILEKSEEINDSLKTDQINENLFELKDQNQFKFILIDAITEYIQQVQKPILNFLENFSTQINAPLYFDYLAELQNYAKQKLDELLEKFNQEHMANQ